MTEFPRHSRRRHPSNHRYRNRKRRARLSSSRSGLLLRREVLQPKIDNVLPGEAHGRRSVGRFRSPNRRGGRSSLPLQPASPRHCPAAVEAQLSRNSRLHISAELVQHGCFPGQRVGHVPVRGQGQPVCLKRLIEAPAFLLDTAAQIIYACRRLAQTLCISDSDERLLEPPGKTNASQRVASTRVCGLDLRRRREAQFCLSEFAVAAGTIPAASRPRNREDDLQPAFENSSGGAILAFLEQLRCLLSPGGRNQEKRCRKGGRTSHTASIQARRFLTQSFSKTRTDVAPLFGPTLVIDIVRVLPSGEIFRIVFPVTVPSRL